MTYRIPAKTTQLGTVLDLLVERGDTRITIDEWRGWLLLTDVNAMQRARPKLYLLRPERSEGDPPAADYSAATGTYERWHRRRAKEVVSYDTPDRIGQHIGTVLRIGYRSDKWGGRGRTHDYDHDFYENDGKPPQLYASAKGYSKARGAVIVGGTMTVSPEGIA